MAPEPALTITSLDGPGLRAVAGKLAELLVATVAAGASIGFLAPLDPAAAEAYWGRVADEVDSGDVQVLVAHLDGRLVGSVQLSAAPLPNARHRAEVRKLMVAPARRRAGVGGLLLTSIEEVAKEKGKWLLVLDTETGSEAERLYRRAGYVEVGEIPRYALGPLERDPRGSTFFYRILS